MNYDPPIALLDACVLYPYTLRDFLLHLALTDAFRPRWSSRIQQEWMINLLERKNNSYTKKQLQRTVGLMDSAFELANVDETQYIGLIPTINLPDKNDRHVLAAAIAAQADFIVTFNLRDFPKEFLSSYGVSAIHPDNFIVELAGDRKNQVIAALNAQSRFMKKWPKTPIQILDILAKLGLKKTRNLFEWSILLE